MNIQEYIASGVLELYATGLLTPPEKVEVERMAELYPEVKAELAAISDTLDTYAQLHALEPPADLKAKILNKIENSSQAAANVNQTNFKNIAFSPDGRSAATYADSRDNTSWWAIAATILLLISAGLNFYFYSNWQTTRKQYQVALATQNQYAQQVRQVNHKYELTAAELAVITHSQTQKVNLKGVRKSPASSAVVYWNTNTKDVFVKIADLPKPPANRQYQLWALENGKPVNAGMVQLEPDSEAVQHMKAVHQAQAFAITLEPKGGSQNPTMEEMYVMGQI
ncbi:anti-sigma factor [Adhaeribacter swui]|uniref:Regulator of SigK n=1 Tax=Adhaeribacter swui TaxID=2086471 RepID=A0A7G7GDX9_9BACT|nr:anti-sigma factor [Adhaeribacter swui]QNF35363.1 anti-sigma factor [Adhaeribacter swui]